MSPLSCALPLLIPLLAIAASPVAGSEPASASEKWLVERSDLAEKLATGAPVTVDNRHGDLRVRVGEPGELSVHGALQRLGGEPALRIEIVSDGAGWRVRVVEPGAARPREGPPRRADLAVVLPADSPLTLRGGSDLVEARGFAAALVAETSTGEIRLRGSGAVNLRSERGAIRVAFHPVTPSAPSRIETLTGDIEVEFPSKTSAEARLETQGSLTTDYSLEVERIGPLTKRAYARLGSGGAEIRLASRTGDLRLLERLAAAPAADP